MAINNPIAVVRDISSSPQHSRDVHVIAGKVEADGGDRVVTINTNLKSLMSTLVIADTVGTPALVAVTVATVTNGTYSVAFTASSGLVTGYLIVGLLSREIETTTVATTTTITYKPITGA
jgi:hypothetical protein